MNSNIRHPYFVIAVLVLLGTFLPLSWGNTAAAESNTGGKLQGTWQVQINPFVCGTDILLPAFSALVSYTRGGTLTEVVNAGAFLPGQVTPGLGAWSRTGGRLYKAVWEVFILFDTPADVPGFPFKRGVQRLTRDIQVFGDYMTFDATSEFQDANGNLLAATCASGGGTRLSAAQ